MSLITRDIDYALRAICCIAKDEKPVLSVAEIVRCLKIPRPFLRKILQVLNREKILQSHKGKGGGFKLTSGADQLSLLDVIVAFQGPVRLNDHKFKGKACPHLKRCGIKKKLDRVEKKLAFELKTITIRSIIKPKRGRTSK